MPLYLVLFLITNMIASVSMDIHLPSVLDMSKEFNTGQVFFQFYLALGILLSTISPLFWGPYSDKVGRSKSIVPVYCALIIGNIGCATSDSIVLLSIFRMIQSFGVGGILTLSIAVICDLYDHQSRTKILSIFELTFTLGLMGAPIMGSFLHENIGFRGCYLIISLLLGCIFSVLLNLEKMNNHKQNLDQSRQPNIIKFLIKKSRTFPFMHYGILRGMVNATYMIFIAYAPYVLMQQMGMNNQQFSMIISSLPLCYILGILFLRISLKYFTHSQVFNFSMSSFLCIGTVILLMKVSILPVNMWVLLALFAFNGFVACPILVISLVQCFKLELQHKEEHNGSFSALLEFYLGAVTAFLILVSSYFLKPKIGNLLTMFSVCGGCCLCLWMSIRIKAKKILSKSVQFVPFTIMNLSSDEKKSDINLASSNSTQKR
ncbi:MAG: hypothetical protein C0432_02355 [Candidatus Puniceispirillum sp.]|nr:hypothetical protein [Candidatus Pelagibacter sp.]MBA4283117.1 hypothetical protein [Candidatus Puniceispirillum sp.]